ncbi:metallophosphoesterase family protein [Deinococcus radiophilus]|uniref:Metallophosphoesterase n=1 Tax=Deinococcus radiophilus TaxID=32062 RepID=A0A431VQL3_9DEIO|nr:metallophosphoesterase family protein [Deinococcus radiophilus]RTR25487.1 metallophosphoesterase [Deinococcus radiophilus]UFA51747.1 metallophosphatase family protein [Deinococcus radiophilus]
MKIAVFGDVHGNRWALEAVRQDIEAQGPDAWVNLGDQLFGGADPAGAWAIQSELREQRGVLEVRGNTDERLGQPLAEATEKRAMLEWLHGQLPDGAAQHVSKLPLSIELAGGAVVCGHGTPSSAWEYLLWNKKAERWKTDDEVMDSLTDRPRAARVVVVGHSHREHLRQIGRLTVINCGAVSRQKDGNPEARWLLLEGEGDVWHAEFRRVDYDIEAAAAWAEAHAQGGKTEAQQLRSGRE